MNRRHAALALFLILTIALSACDTATSPAVPATVPSPASPAAEVAPPAISSAPTVAAVGERVTITFSLFESERSAFEPLVAAFESENPDTHVQLVMLASYFSRGEPPNYERVVLSAADTTNFPISAESIVNDWVRDLTPLMEADPSFDRADFYPGAIEAGSNEHGFYLMPRSLRLPVLFYNKDLWAARGLPLPKPDWTWNDLFGATEQLARQRGDTTATYGLLDWFVTAVRAGAFVDVGIHLERSEQVRLDDPNVAAGVERIARLIKSGAILSTHSPNIRRDGEHPDEKWAAELIRNGQVGMWSPNLCCYNLESRLPSFAIGVVPFPVPVFSDFTQVDSFAMSSGTAHPEAVWRWLSFLSRQEYPPVADFQNEATTVPARRSVAERSGFWQNLAPEYVAGFKTALEGPSVRHSIGLAPPPFFYRIDFDPIFDTVVSGRQTAQAALRDAQRAHEQLALLPSPTPDTRPIAVATPLPEAPTSAIRITFGAVDNDDQLRHLASAFTQQHPGIFVQIQPRDVSQIPPSPAERAAQADCFVAYGMLPADQAATTLDLQPLIDADPSFNLADYPPALLAPFRHAGALHGLPRDVYVRMLHYNQTAFDAAGVAHPTAAWTLDDFCSRRSN